jgi:glycosyltransferase involved in cell wall biosynthesis
MGKLTHELNSSIILVSRSSRPILSTDMSMSHIVFVSFDGSKDYGGPTVNASRLLPELRRRDHRVTALLVTDDEETTHLASLRDAGVDCRVLPRGGYTEDLAQMSLALLDELQPSVFVPNIWIPGCFAARWAREAGVPTVAAYRSDDPLYEGILDQFVFGDPAWAVSGMVCVSKDLENRVRQRRPKDTRTAVIPSGVPIPGQGHVHGDRFRIAYVGRISQRQKRILDVGGAIISALEAIPEADAAFFGHGDETPQLRRLVEESGMAQRIEIAGSVDPSRIQSCLLAFDVVVLLSDYEGTPGALMDAMACGLVPVVLDIPGGVRELVINDETGVLVKDRDREFVDAIKDLHKMVERRAELGQRARDHITARFSLRRAADLWEELFESLRAEAGRSSPIGSASRLRLPQPVPALVPHMHCKPPPLRRLLAAAQRILFRSPSSSTQI